MSDPMTNTEIEDVLSSIRRLVSEDLRPAPRSAPVPEAAAPRQEQPRFASGKLILTPALRVVSAEEEEPQLTLTAKAEPVQDFSGLHAEVDAPDEDSGVIVPSSADVHDGAESFDVVSRLGAAVQGDDEWESPVGDLDTFGEAATSQTEVKAPTRSLFGRPEPLGSRLHLSTPMSEEPDFLSEPEAQHIAEDEPPVFDAEAQEEARPAFVPLRRAEPPADEDWADAAEAEVRAELEKGLEDQTVANVYEGQEVAFDEEVLRDLVRDIIREELAGSLGERITRNVRKLVRAEIARALAVREFE